MFTWILLWTWLMSHLKINRHLLMVLMMQHLNFVYAITWKCRRVWSLKGKINEPGYVLVAVRHQVALLPQSDSRHLLPSSCWLWILIFDSQKPRSSGATVSSACSATFRRYWKWVVEFLNFCTVAVYASYQTPEAVKRSYETCSSCVYFCSTQIHEEKHNTRHC